MGHAERSRLARDDGGLGGARHAPRVLQRGRKLLERPRGPCAHASPRRFARCLPAALPVPAQAMHGASPVPRCLVFRSRLMRHADLGARIFLFGNLFRRPPAGASPSPPPAGWLRGLRRRPQASPAACPAPALESRVWAACAGHLLWARGALHIACVGAHGSSLPPPTLQQPSANATPPLTPNCEMRHLL